MKHEDYCQYPIKVMSKAGVEDSMTIMKKPDESIFDTARNALKDGEKQVDKSISETLERRENNDITNHKTLTINVGDQ